MRVAVVGGTGLVGALACERLAEHGHEVVAVARRERGSRRLAEVARFRAADVGDPASLREALSGCDAAVSCFGGLRQTPDATYRDVHVRGLANLLTACRERGVRRFVHLSALGARPSSQSAFHRAKHAGEQRLWRGQQAATVIRPSVVFGPGLDGAGDDFLVPLAAMLRQLPVAPLPGPGGARLQPVAARDVAHAIAAALTQPDTVGKAFDLPGPELVTVVELYRRVLRAARLVRPMVRVPYLLIEPLSHLYSTLPGVRFSFDQLAILESERPADPHPAAAALDLTLRPFSVAAIRAAIRHTSRPAAVARPL